MSPSPAPIPARSRTPRRLGAGALVGAAAVLLSGCYGITDQTAAQRNVIGDLDVTTSFCVTGSASTPITIDSPIVGISSADPHTASTTDADGCVTGETSENAYATQLFVAYQVPDGVEAPKEIDATGSLGDVDFHLDSAFAEAVEAGDPTPVETTQTRSVVLPANKPAVGTHWVSYSSGTIPKQVAHQAAVKAALEVPFNVASLGDTPFTLRSVSGWRWVNGDTWSADRGIVCGQPEDGPGGSTAATDCSYSEFPRAQQGVTTAPVQTFALNQLTIDNPADLTAKAGETKTISFPAHGTPADPAAPASVPLDAASDLGPVTAPSSLVLSPTGKVDVTLTVPAGAAPGYYLVELNAGTRGTHGTRRAFTTVQVVASTPTAAPTATPAPKATPTPAPALTVPQQLANTATALATALSTPGTGKALHTGTATVPFTVPVRGFYRVSFLGKAKKGKKAPVLAVGTVESDKGQTTNLKLRRTADGKRILGGKATTVSGTLVIRLWGRDGKTVSTPVTVTLDD